MSARSGSAYSPPLLAVLYTDMRCRCGRALTGRQLDSDSVAAGGATRVFQYGKNGGIYAICTSTQDRIQMPSAVQPFVFNMNLDDLGWEPRLTSLVRNSKYRFFTRRTDWESAQRICTLHGGHLAILEDTADLREVLLAMQASDLAPESQGLALWLGLQFAQAGLYRWIDGTPLAYGISLVDEWDYASPNCGFLDVSAVFRNNTAAVNGSVRAGGCSNGYQFMCETSTSVDTSLADISSGEERVVTGLSPLLGSWRITLYRSHLVTWHDAAKICKYKGQDLVWFFNDAEVSFMRSWLNATNITTGIWTGLSADNNGRMGWRTNMDTPSVWLSTWSLPAGAAASVPASASGGGFAGVCGQYDPSDPTGTRMLLSCGEVRPFACKSGSAWSGPPATLGAVPQQPAPVNSDLVAAAEISYSRRGFTYLYYSKARTWSQAAAFCGSLGGQLAEFSTRDDFAALARKFSSFFFGKTSEYYKNFWTGLIRDATDSRVFRYASGNVPATAESVWGEGEPRAVRTGTENCVEGGVYFESSTLMNELLKKIVREYFTRSLSPDEWEQASGRFARAKIERIMLNYLAEFGGDFYAGLKWAEQFLTSADLAALKNEKFAWRVSSCTAAAPVMCMITNPAAAADSKSQDLARLEYQFTLGGQHYSVYGALLDNLSARDFCAARGQTLADFTSRSEYNTVLQSYNRWLYTQPLLAERRLTLWTGYSLVPAAPSAPDPLALVNSAGVPVDGGSAFYLRYWDDLQARATGTPCVSWVFEPQTQKHGMLFEDCGGLYRPLCAADRVALAPVAESTSGPVRYAFFREPRTWSRALQVCLGFKNGTLATFTDPEWAIAQSQFLNPLFTNNSVAWPDVNTFQQSLWMGTDSLASIPVEDCAFIAVQRSSGAVTSTRLTGADCAVASPFVCMYTNTTVTPPAAAPTPFDDFPARTLVELGVKMAAQVSRGAFTYTVMTDASLRTTWARAALACKYLPSASGVLATLFSAEDLQMLAATAQAAEGKPLGLWLGLADFLSPGTPYWTAGSLQLEAAARDLASSWPPRPLAPGSNVGCGYLDTASGSLLRGACDTPMAFICMAPSTSLAPQHSALAEMSGDGLPDLVLATNCPYDGGASLIGLQQPSPPDLASRSDAIARPALSARVCGDGIPTAQREECDLGEGNGEVPRLCSAGTCLIQESYVVQASAHEAYITLGYEDKVLEHFGTDFNLYGQVRGFKEITPGEPLLFTGFSNTSSEDGYPTNEPIAVHRTGQLSPGKPFQFRAFLTTDKRQPPFPDWEDAETAPTNSWLFKNGTTTCGCTPDNPGGAPMDLSVTQSFSSIQFSWTVGSACESHVSITRALVDAATGVVTNTTTVAQLSIGLACGVAYRPSTTEVDEDIVRDKLQVGLTYRYCVSVSSDALTQFFLDAANPLDSRRFVSEPACRDVTIQWSGRLTGEVRTRYDTPAPGVRLSARLLDSSYVESTVTDDSGHYELTMQSDIPSCDPAAAPEQCLSQLVMLTASQRTKLRTGRVILHSFSIQNRAGSSQTLAVQHMSVTEGLRILDESALPISGTVAWPGNENNAGFDQTRGCPIFDAAVCAVNARDNSSVACSNSDADGSFLVTAGIGSVLRLEVKWNNHTFAVAMPDGVKTETNGAFELTEPVYDVDVRDVTTRQLRIGLTGGLCEFALGKPTIQFSAYDCLPHSSQPSEDRRIVLEADVPYGEFTMPALAWEVTIVDVTETLPGLPPPVIINYLRSSDQLQQFVNLTGNPSDSANVTVGTLEDTPDVAAVPAEVNFVFVAPNDIELEVCRDNKGAFVLCGDYDLDRMCNAGPAAAAYANIWSAFRTPDNLLVKKDAVVLRRAARYKARIRLYQMYGSRRCDNVQDVVMIADSIGGEVPENACSLERKGCMQSVSLQDKTNTSEYVYDLVPGAINFGAETAFSLPLTVVAPSSDGWPARSYLLFAVVEGSQSRAGTGYIEIPIPVPLLILRDPPGDGSYATLESSVSTAIKLSMTNHDKSTCGGLGNMEMFIKALPWNLLNGLPFGKLGSSSKIAKSVEKSQKLANKIRALQRVEKVSVWGKIRGAVSNFYKGAKDVKNAISGATKAAKEKIVPTLQKAGDKLGRKVGKFILSKILKKPKAKGPELGKLDKIKAALTKVATKIKVTAQKVDDALTETAGVIGGKVDEAKTAVSSAVEKATNKLGKAILKKILKGPGKGGKEKTTILDDVNKVFDDIKAFVWDNFASKFDADEITKAIDNTLEVYLDKPGQFLERTKDQQKYLKGLKKYFQRVYRTEKKTEYVGETDPKPDGLTLGRGAGLSFRRTTNVTNLVNDIFEVAGMEVDEPTAIWLLGELMTAGEDESALLLANMVEHYDKLGEEAISSADEPMPKINLNAMTVAFNRDPYVMGPGNKGWGNEASKIPEMYTPKSPEFQLNPTGLKMLYPICAKSTLGLGFDLDVQTCAGWGFSVCTPSLRDRGTAGIISDKAYYNDEEGENYYKMTITREEGFSTPQESSPEMSGGGGDMILAPTFAIQFIISDRLDFDRATCSAQTTMGIPSWDLKEDLHGTAWHSVWHIKNVIIPELQTKLAAEAAKPAAQQRPDIANNLQQGLRGWTDILSIYSGLTDIAKEHDEELPNYQVGQQDVNGLVQGTVESVWHVGLDDHEERNSEAFEGRGIDPERLEQSPVWKLGYFEGTEKLQQLMLRTQAYMDNSSTMGNIVTAPHAKAAVGGVAMGKQVDALQQAYGVQFNTFSFSGGGGSYTYSLKTHSTISTKVQFSISFKDMFGFQGGGGGGTGLWIESHDENLYGFELDFSSALLQETERERTVSFTLKDKDPGDSFLIKVKPDLAFGTPMFELLAGRSKCPYEPGTQRREMVGVSVVGGAGAATQSNIKQGEEALYELLLENQSDTDEAVAFDLGPDLASNSGGAYLQIMGAPWISPVPFKLPGPRAKQTRALVSGRCGPRSLTADVNVAAASSCSAEPFGTTTLSLRCYSACPQVSWPPMTPLADPIILNLTDSSAPKKNLTINLFNPAYTFQRWLTHPRLNGTARIVIEYTSPSNDGGVWSRLRLPNGTDVNFVGFENAFGFATYNWNTWDTVLVDGVYLMRFVTICNTLGGATDTRFEGRPVTLLVDRLRPVPTTNSLWPSMSYLPGDPISVTFSELLDCRRPFSFQYTINITDGSPATSTFTILSGDSRVVASCAGNSLALNWDPLSARSTLMIANRNAAIRIWGVQDLAGNVLSGTVNFTFTVGAVNPATPSPVVLNIALGALNQTAVRRLLAAPSSGLAAALRGGDSSSPDGGWGLMPPWLRKPRFASAEEEDAYVLARVEASQATTRQLLGEVNAILASCLASDPAAALAQLEAAAATARVPALLGGRQTASDDEEDDEEEAEVELDMPVMATSVVQDERTLTMMVELMAVPDEATGENAAGVASRVAEMARDPASCLASRLAAQYAAVRAVTSPAGLEQQLLEGMSAEELAATRRAAAAAAQAAGAAATWAATLATYGVAAPVVEAAARAAAGVLSPDEAQLQEHPDAGIATEAAAAGVNRGSKMSGLLADVFARHMYAASFGAMLVLNLVALTLVAVIWRARRRSSAPAVADKRKN